ncbi:MAG: lytic transglycosylase domain-containing protein [Rhodoblastus sp.]
MFAAHGWRGNLFLPLLLLAGFECDPARAQEDLRAQEDSRAHAHPRAGEDRADALAAPAPLQAIIRKKAQEHGVPAFLVDVVTHVESSYRAGAVGSVGEIGLMQVRPTTAASLGFAGDVRELARPEVNVDYGARYLARAWRQTGGDLCRALMKYRAGLSEERMSPLSVFYCAAARRHLAASGVLDRLDPAKSALPKANFFPRGGVSVAGARGWSRISVAEGGYLNGGRGAPAGYIARPRAAVARR